MLQLSYKCNLVIARTKSHVVGSIGTESVVLVPLQASYVRLSICLFVGQSIGWIAHMELNGLKC